MKSGFDISLVISLSSSLSVGTDLESLSGKPIARSFNEERALGDFTAVWQYLGSSVSSRPEQDRQQQSNSGISSSVATPNGLEKDESLDRPEKKTRHVTFDAVTSVPQVLLSKQLPCGTPPSSTLYPERIDITTATHHTFRHVLRSSSTGPERKAAIVKKLITMFPRETGLLAPNVGTQPNGIHIFVDNSNVLISFYDLIKKARGFKKYEPVRRPAFTFHGLTLILERGRPVAKRVLVGSSPITREIQEAKECDYETSILERVLKESSTGENSKSSGSESAGKNRKRKVEQGVDEIIHLKILESVLDYPPSTIVLASGDGAAGEYSPGFTKVIERCLTRGWEVEILSFKQNLSGFYRNKEFKKTWKDKFRFIPLDGFVEELLD